MTDAFVKKFSSVETFAVHLSIEKSVMRNHFKGDTMQANLFMKALL